MDLLSSDSPSVAALSSFRFGKSTALYASWLFMFIVVGEFMTGKLTDYAWTANNYGKTFATVDWSKFDNFEDEEGDDDDE